MVARWLPSSFTPLGTDGFGRSDTREALRSFFEVDPPSIAAATLAALARCGRDAAAQSRKGDRRARRRSRKADPRLV
jgi:pyruvate dehydrogenase E1 component